MSPEFHRSSYWHFAFFERYALLGYRSNRHAKNDLCVSAWKYKEIDGGWISAQGAEVESVDCSADTSTPSRPTQGLPCWDSGKKMRMG
jgi:hypothetical protein